MEIDQIDLKILKMVQENARISLNQISEKLKIPKSTIAYRLKKMEQSGLIRGYHAQIDFSKLDIDYVVISLIKAKYGPNYHDDLGSKLAKLPQVWGVYYLLGEWDFVVMAKFRNREKFMAEFLEKVMSIPEVERSNTQIVAKVIKEDPYEVKF
ncbi:putative HTH-type transcriptional regulator [Sulfuracidifex tepidarius]|uniref:HTH-type transcriptional regulator n=2 Tax=Sulfuracidifex tepidarius TaxID=1294262 RepID=A0A510E5H1_9CREN|nr:putative HTH-type transcriptional regulator [Sulfuracidifex tepidarius]